MAAGDQLVTPRHGYTHHGVDLGNGRVIHYSGFANGFESGKVEITSMWRFRAGRRLERKRPKNAAFGISKSIARAASRLGENEYNLVTNNCEHFAEWCVTGQHQSHQVNKIRRLMTRTLIKAPLLLALRPLPLPFVLGAGPTALALVRALDRYVENGHQRKRELAESHQSKGIRKHSKKLGYRVMCEVHAMKVARNKSR